MLAQFKTDGFGRPDAGTGSEKPGRQESLNRFPSNVPSRSSTCSHRQFIALRSRKRNHEGTKITKRNGFPVYAFVSWRLRGRVWKSFVIPVVAFRRRDRSVPVPVNPENRENPENLGL
jgi:hypothetical protein